MKFRLWKCLILSALAFVVTAARAQEIPKEIPRIVISYYPDSTKFGYQQWLREAQGEFESYFSLRLKFKGASMCNSLLEANQLFPLNRMQSTGYISQEQVSTLIKMGDRLKASQFRFFELIKTVDGNDLAGKHLDATRGDIPYSVFPVLGEKAGLTQGTLWSVAAQSTSSHVKLAEEKMPWQLDEAYRETPIDRTKIKLAWELGRGAQVEGEAKTMDSLFEAAALGMLKESLAHGIHPKDAFVFMHAMGKVQARLFKMRKSPKTGKPVFSSYANGGTEDKPDEVLIAGLQDLLDTFPPTKFSKRIKGIRDLTNGRLDWLGAVEHIYTVRDYFRQDLTLVSPNILDQTHPIVFRNTTPTAGWFMAKVSQKYGVYDAGKSISQYLSSTGWHASNVPPTWSVDPLVPDDTVIGKNQAISLSNFSDSTAKSNPNYAKLVLMAAYFYWERTLASEYPEETSHLMDLTQFVIHSSHTSVIEQTKNISGVHVEMFQSVDHNFDMDLNEGNLSLKPRLNIHGGPGFIFNRRAILKLIQSEPALAREARNALRKGNWQIMNMSNDMGVL